MLYKPGTSEYVDSVYSDDEEQHEQHEQIRSDVKKQYHNLIGSKFQQMNFNQQQRHQCQPGNIILHQPQSPR